MVHRCAHTEECTCVQTHACVWSKLLYKRGYTHSLVCIHMPVGACSVKTHSLEKGVDLHSGVVEASEGGPGGALRETDGLPSLSPLPPPHTPHPEASPPLLQLSTWSSQLGRKAMTAGSLH